MTPSVRQEKKGLLGLLGIGRSAAGDQSRLSMLAEQMRAEAPGSRAEIIASMAEFLDWHDLEISDVALSVAHNYVTNADALLVRLIDERVANEQPVTLQWLERLTGNVGDDMSSNDLNETVEKLEKQLVDFGASATAARQATREYGQSLEDHAEQLGSDNGIDASVTELLATVRGMIARTAQMEKEMSRSEQQSRELRNSLETALRTAEEDDLTGLPNRRAFEKTFKEEFEAAREAVESLFVAFCDIDHFKRVNDNHGHDTGDRVLQLVARELSLISGKQCFIARHGGEEFAVLLRGISQKEAIELLDTAREKLRQRRLVDRETEKPIGYISFSAGIADVFAYPDRSAALKAADIALYHAKEQGRNRIVAAQI